MTLAVERTVYDAMLAAARAAAPVEACGLCGGNDGRVTQFYELTNADASAEHYSLKPSEQFAAIKDMRAKGLRMLAIWHSHPASPARMSQEDLRLAYTPDVTYLILSLAVLDTPDLRGYIVENGSPVPVEVTCCADTCREEKGRLEQRTTGGD
jgi:[CysO sulfur-carrier protein]-S-L-cysteine hydrolase